MPADQSGGMDKGLMRQLLVRSRREPVNCAVGQAKDGSALLLMDKVKQPKALEKELEKSNPGAKNTRFGSVHIDEVEDPKLAILRLNKAVSGFGRKLVKTLKGTGVTKVTLRYDDGTPDEVTGEEEDIPPQDSTAATASPDIQDASSGAAIPAPIAGTDDGAGEAEAFAEPMPADSAPVAAAPADAAPANDESAAEALDATPDLRPLTAQLTALVKRMMPLIAADASRLESLKGLASLAQQALKAGDVQSAGQAMASLQSNIAAFEQSAPAAQAAPQAVPPADVATLVKARTAWVATRTRVDAELAKLTTAIKDTYKDHDAIADIEKSVREKLDTVLDRLDDSLAHKLDEVREADPADRPKLVIEAKKILQRYQTHLENDKVLGALDDNPFVPISVLKTVSATMQALHRSLH